tara:strand:- start:405 stop:677 length:273 start_codon:yes stop_codon:yes gene_type:complete
MLYQNRVHQWIYYIYEFAKDGNADQTYAYIRDSRGCFLPPLHWLAEDYERGDIEDQEFCQSVVKECAWFFISSEWNKNKNQYRDDLYRII